MGKGSKTTKMKRRIAQVSKKLREKQKLQPAGGRAKSGRRK
jgi:hypothetical protein